MAVKSPDNDNEAPLAIIGGGLAGTMFLVHTLNRIAEDPTITSPVKIKMLERYPEQMQGGVAYSKGPAFRGHNLNSGAKSLNFFPVGKYPAGFPTFVEYIEQQAKLRRDPAILHALTDPPRQMVGEYMKHMLDIALVKAGGKAHVDFEVRNIIALDKKPEGGAVLQADDGTKLEASHVILATGFQESLAPKFARAVAGNPHFVGQPYTSKANAVYGELVENSKKDVLIIGTGLTGMDIATRLIHSGYTGKITMMSRRGLMHKSFDPTTPKEYFDLSRIKGEPRPQAELDFAKVPPKFLQATTVPGLVAAVMAEYAELTAKGNSSIEILSYWERFAPDVAAKFPQKDVAQLYGAYETLITTLRAGVTPDTGVTIQGAIASGQLTIGTGIMKNVEEKDGKLVATFARTSGDLHAMKTQFGAAQERTVQAAYDYVFSAMGNSTSFDPTFEEIRDPLWAKLMRDGIAQPHWTKAGVDVSRDFSLKDKDGKADPSISVIGVPVAGHMVVTKYPYPDAPAVQGGKMGPASLNASAIMSETLTLLEARYNDLVVPYRSRISVGAVPVQVQRVQGLKR